MRLYAGVPGADSPWVPSPGPRPGYYLRNFYDAQPALNFGYAELRDGEPWRVPPEAPGPQRNVQALRDIMAFWIDRGVAGFRVDMAFSLVKADPGYRRTLDLWRELRDWLSETYPEAVLIPEGSEPRGDTPPSFDADFFLVIQRAHSSLFNNGGAGSVPWYAPAPCFFDADGEGSTAPFLEEWAGAREGRPGRPVILATADHDFSRLVCGSRDARAGPRGVRVPAHVGLDPVDLLRRRDRPALPARSAGQGRLRRPPDVQPSRCAHADAVGRLGQRGLLDHRPTPTCRSTPRRTGRPWPGRSTTRAPCCTWSAG